MAAHRARSRIPPNALETGIRHPKPAVERILRAALRCLARKDSETLSMREIAEEAGVSKALLHYHFHSKDELLLELQDRLITSLIERVEMVTQGMAAYDQSSTTAFLISMDAIWQVLRGAGDVQAIALRLAARGTLEDPIRQRLLRFRTRLQRAMATGVRRSLGRNVPADTPIDAAAELLLACLIGLEVERFFAEEPSTLDRAFDLLKTWLTSGRSGFPRRYPAGPE